MAVSADEVHDRQTYQYVLVFHLRTGELLAHEQVLLKPRRQVLAYGLFLRFDRTDRVS